MLCPGKHRLSKSLPTDCNHQSALEQLNKRSANLAYKQATSTSTFYQCHSLIKAWVPNERNEGSISLFTLLCLGEDKSTMTHHLPGRFCLGITSKGLRWTDWKAEWTTSHGIGPTNLPLASSSPPQLNNSHKQISYSSSQMPVPRKELANTQCGIHQYYH